ncbi:MAG: hypothetical protein C3F15_15775 [Holophagae bacterium]|nr:MAG: hypothetical protein C3F15_15775 [Holophagae bacterium]
MSDLTGRSIAHYRVTAKLGEGGMGEVYRATDTKLKRDVAIKVLPIALAEDTERLARFEREAQLLAQLQHPNIASIYGLEESGGVRALVMELVEGPTLADRLESGALPLDQCVAISLQVAQALEEAHDKGIIHRDLKPQNIKAPVDGKVKVLDFGLAKAMDPEVGVASAASLARSPTMTAVHGTQLGVILGTAAYMAPEQARGGSVDKRADVWAFGVVLYEMLTGRALFAADTVTDTLAGVLKTEIDFSALPASTPAEIRRLVRRCLERNPKNRLHDIADARIVLEELNRSGEAGNGLPSPAAPPGGRSRRELAAWALALLATAVAVALLAGRLGAPRGVATEAPRVTRFAVAPEEKGIIQGYPALSPDGRTLVYSMLQEDGSAALWAHSFETGTSRRLPGTDGAEEPFWAPDGKQLGFFAVGQLKRLDLASGLTQNLHRVADPRGGTWTRDGDILCSVNSVAPILRISAGSGESRAATELASDKGEQSHRFPWALPGGGFVFTSTGAPGIRGIYWHGRGTSSWRRILPDLSRAVYDERGYLLWVRDGFLVAQRFDPETGELSGELLPLAEKIGENSQKTAESWFATSASGVVAFRQGARQWSELVWLDRKGATLGAVATPGTFNEPALSRDGRQVVVTISPPNESPNLWIYESSGLDRGRRLTFDAAGAESGIWSPDGRWVAYSSASEEGYRFFRKAADGSGEEELLFEAGSGGWVDSWSPDGGTLLFELFVPERGADLWLLPLDGQRQPVPFLETPANETHAAFSPDGRFVAYVSDEGGLAQIYVQTVSASGSRWQVSRDGGDWPAWSADGKELFYGGLDRVLYSVSIASLAPLTFGAQAPLFRLRTPQPAITSNRTFFEPSPDGRRFLVNQLVGSEGGDRIDVLMNWAPLAGQS